MTPSQKKLVVIEVPGFARHLLQHAPYLRGLAERQQHGTFQSVFPALTLPSHASLMTGVLPHQHGLLANGFHDRSLNQTFMWPQSEKLITETPLWEKLQSHHPSFSSLKYFCWPGMASSASLSGNVRPVYHADGRKSPGLYMSREGLADHLEQKFGAFPLFRFWGPATNISSSAWILNSASNLLEQEHIDLSFIYVPHLDYRQQTLGPKHPSIQQDVKELDAVLETFIQGLDEHTEVVVMSSYSITEVSRPIAINRHLREKGFLKVVCNRAGELVDTANSQAFAIADHQVALVYTQAGGNKQGRADRNASLQQEVQACLQELDGVESVKVTDNQFVGRMGDGNKGKENNRMDNNRKPNLLCTAEQNAWFTYPYWLDDDKAPDFAKTVAIHDKMGYDPCEMLIDSRIKFPRLTMAKKLLQKKCGFRTLMDIISLEPERIKGSHGRIVTEKEDQPIWIGPQNFCNDESMTVANLHQSIERFFAEPSL